MYQIIPGKLWLGNARDGREVRALGDAQIECIVDLAFEEPPAQLPRELMYLRIPLKDGGGNSIPLLRMAVATVAGLLRSDIQALICCSGGMSRSPAIAAFALSTVNGQSATEVLNQIRCVKPVDVSPAFWNELHQVAHTKHHVETVPKSWSLWRQDDNGNQAVVVSGLTQADAQLMAKTYEDRGHKQLYWVTEEIKS